MKDNHHVNNNQAEPQYKIQASTEIRHFHLPVIDSTNTWAKLKIEDWIESGMTVFTASTQTAGRGRFKREWISPPGVNIYATFCFCAEGIRPDFGQITQLLAYSAVKVLQRHSIFSKIKWPNDLMLDGQKVAGILCETTPCTQGIGIACGIGLNVNMPLDVIKQINQPATSLFLHSGIFYSVDQLIKELEQEFYRNLTFFVKEGFKPFLTDFLMQNYYQKGQELCIQEGSKKWGGQFQELSETGSLTLLLKDGTVRTFISGEIKTLV